MDASVVLVGLVILLIYFLHVITEKKFNFWTKKNVPYVKPLPIIGNYGKYILLQEYVGILVQKLCWLFPNSPYFGAFFGMEPVLIVQSPEILKLILIKDFNYFNGREISNYTDKEVITQNLFFTSGDKWKTLRKNLNPLFSSTKMKDMFYLIEKYCHKFEAMMDFEVGNHNVIEAKKLSARYTMDCIISCGFGVEANTIDKPDNNPFTILGEEIFKSTNYAGFKIIFRAIWPAAFYSLGFKVFSPTIGAFFSNLLKTVLESRNYKPSSRKDFVDLLLKLKDDNVNTIDENYLFVDDNILAAQCALFFGAGFETSATTLSFTLFELAKNQDVQRRAAEEVDEYMRRHGNKLHYDCINELPYLEACMYETLRKYPVIGNLTREVMDDYTLPDGLQLDKGIRIHIPVYSIHHNPKYFPEPDVYNPDRFLHENKKFIKQYTFFPYGEGSRICLGKRFSKMQVLPGLISILKKYRIELADGMPLNVNLESRSFLIQTRNQGIMLKAFQREGWEQKKFISS